MEAQQFFGAMRPPTTSFTSSLAATQVPGSLYSNHCNSHSFSPINLFGAKILNIEAEALSVSTSLDTSKSGFTSTGTWADLQICNVTVTYTHPGRKDQINVNAWLPLALDDWSGRFLASGGGGWLTGRPAEYHAPIVERGFATASTDGGHSVYDTSSESWALNSPGNVDLNMLQNFASVALSDLAVIGKQITELYYGKPAEKAYWAGCSTGGRQGLMLAQRYPDLFDGILAIAPAINWSRFIIAEFWAQHVINRLGYYPTPAELEAVTQAAIEACDEIDGVKDGIISLPGECHFDALALVGKIYTDSEGGEIQHFTTEAATIANAAWRGPKSSNGRYDWYGLNHDAPLTNGLLNTDCQNSSASSCTGEPFMITSEWLRFFVAKVPSFDLTTLTDEEYFDLFHKSVQEYDSIIGTADPDLSAFKNHGGKMITWHGLADPLIFPNGTSDYYKRVLDIDPEAADFYRYFEAPGMGHCSGGIGPAPVDALQALMDWVENDVTPETLLARTGDVERMLCAWPKVQRYVGGNPNVPGSFECV